MLDDIMILHSMSVFFFHKKKNENPEVAASGFSYAFLRGLSFKNSPLHFSKSTRIITANIKREEVLAMTVQRITTISTNNRRAGSASVA